MKILTMSSIDIVYNNTLLTTYIIIDFLTFLQNTCRLHEAYLVDIDDAEENEWITKTLLIDISEQSLSENAIRTCIHQDIMGVNILKF